MKQVSRLNAVYPRVCGGTDVRWFHWSSLRGLSPRVRGNHNKFRSHPSLLWSIPACAGEPMLLLTPGLLFAVYPRVCGGTSRRVRATVSHQGLSPRVRGNLVHIVPPEIAIRSIPACAGEPPTNTISMSSSSVYPRVCGGTRGYSGGDHNSRGLSPRVRGNHLPVLRRQATTRSIPACAGEPR